MTESRSHLAGTTPFQNRIPVRLLAPQHVKGRLGQMARLCHEPLARGMNATHLRIISCPREGREADSRPPIRDQPAARAIQTCPIPTSTLISTPVMYHASSEAKNAPTDATSSGFPNRFIG